MKNRMMITAAMALALFANLAGCDDGRSPVKAEAQADECGLVAPNRTEVTFPNDKGDTLRAVVLGSGPVGVVLAHQSNGNLCQWEEYALVLAAKGYRALAFDFAGNGGSTGSPRRDVQNDVIAAAGYLRGQGVTSVVLMGASMGGGASVAAAAKISPPVTAVVDISGGQMTGDISLSSVVGSLTMPVLYLVADKDTTFANAAAELAPLTTSPGSKYVVITTSDFHGVGLLYDDAALAAIDTFLTTAAPPK